MLKKSSTSASATTPPKKSEIKSEHKLLRPMRNPKMIHFLFLSDRPPTATPSQKNPVEIIQNPRDEEKDNPLCAVVVFTLHFNSLSPSSTYMRQWTNHHWFRLVQIWTNAWNFNEIHIISIKKIHLEILSVKWRKFYQGLNVLSIMHTLCLLWLRNGRFHPYHSAFNI